MTPLTVLIAGEPVAKGRPRVVRTKAGVRAITPEKTREWTSYAVRVLAWWQRRELREFAATCDCPRGQHYAISPSWVNWNTLADLAWKHADTVLDATGRPCVQLDPRPELISQWSKECQR